MNYISLFSGIEAASAAWEPLGWNAIAFAEVDPFCCEVLAKHYPNVPNVGNVKEMDWTKYKGDIDVIIGGSPCQSFSIAGKRQGLKGESGLMFEYIRAIREIMPRYFIWENVQGALSSEDGKAFGQLLCEMDELGFGLAWTVLDAQFFGVAQRRRRLFLIGCLGNAGRAAQILFDGESMRWDYPSSREMRKRLARNVQRRLKGCCSTLRNRHHFISKQDAKRITVEASNGEDYVGALCARDFKGVGSQFVSEGKVIAYREGNQYAVRKLTPLEYERLQGFPDGWTDIEIDGKQASDAARYKALGNSMALPVIFWLGCRIKAFDGYEEAPTTDEAAVV